MTMTKDALFPDAAPLAGQQIYDERDRLVILTPCFAHQVTTLFRDSVDVVLGTAPTARFRCADGKVRVLPLVAMALNQPNDSHIDRARNTILWHFEQTPYRLGLFCDGDQPFEPEHIARTWAHLMTGVRVLGGCVALKTIVTTFAANIKKGATPDATTGLLDGQDTGTGWMGFRRDVLDEIRTRWPVLVRNELADALHLPPESEAIAKATRRLAELGYSFDLSYKSNSNTATAGQTLHAYFASGVTFRDGAGDWLSEDWMLCHRCLQLGIPIKIDTNVRVKHFGPMLFPPPPEEVIQAALQVTSGEYVPFDPKLAAAANAALAALHADNRNESISVLHATRGRPAQALRIRETFLRNAMSKDFEYVFAVDEDDAESIKALREFNPVIVPPSGGIVAAINAAAKFAKGRILIMAADDCVPPVMWDRSVRQALRGHLHEPRVLAVGDGFSNQALITHPIMTRAFYEAQGGYFYCPEYPHLFCDTELTERAQANRQIIDAGDIVFRHEHPMFTGAKPDALHAERNSKQAWETGRAIFRRRNPNSKHPHAQ